MANNTKRNAKGGGTIRKRADGRWEARFSMGFDPKTGKQIQKSVYGQTQKEVRQKLSAALTELDSGTYIAPTSMKLGAWLDQWLQAYTGNVKPATKGAYEEHIRVHIKPYLGEVKLAKLTAPMVQNVYNTLLEEKGLSAKSVKNIHGVLHRALEQAKKLNYLRENPLDAVILPRTEKPQLQTMDDADMIAFLQAIEGDAYEIELFVDAFTGLRQGELLGLTWDCVDFEHQTLLIDKQHNRAKGEKEFHFSSLKTEKVRSLTVTDEVMDALRRQQRRQAAWKAAAGELWSNPDNLVFTTEFGRYVNNKTLYMNFKRVMRSQGLSELRFHDLRHTFAVNSLKAGDDIKTVQENLGHATASFTLSTCAHDTPGMKRESANRMGQYLRRIRESTEAAKSSV